MEVLDCVVSPDWALALAGVNTGHLPSVLARGDLWQEFLLLEKLLYKNSNQHRGAQHYQRLLEVRRLLRLLKAMQLDHLVQSLHDSLQVAKQRGSLPIGSVLMAYGGDKRRVPSHQAAAAVLRSLQAACHLIEELAPAVQRSSLQLLAQLAHSFFMPFCLTSLAVLARIQVLAGQLMLDAVKAYNTLAEAAALLPLSPADMAKPPTARAALGATSAAQQQQRAVLPQMLRAEWWGGRPRFDSMPCPEGESLAEQAAAACSRYAVYPEQPEVPPTAAEAAPPPLQGRRQQRGKQQHEPLAVVEDRGVPISREAFAAAGAAGAAVAAVAGMPRGNSTAEEAAAAAPPLLGVVEDGGDPGWDEDMGSAAMLAVDEADVAPADATGDVASLMEGEALGHLYRRSTLALGVGLKLGEEPQDLNRERKQEQQEQQARAAATPDAQAGGSAPAGADPAAPTAAGTPAAAAPAAVPKVVGVGRAAGAAGVQPAPSKPLTAATASAANAALETTGAAIKPALFICNAAKPAFLSVAALPPKLPAAKPAFLPVAAPAAAKASASPQPAAVLNSGGSSAPVLPAQAADSLPAAPLALAAGGGRKRKKPSPGTAAAAAAAAPAVVQQVAEAAAPKSWEDWLQPLGGAPSGISPATEPAIGRRQQQQGQGKRRKGR